MRKRALTLLAAIIVALSTSACENKFVPLEKNLECAVLGMYAVNTADCPVW